MSGNSRVIFSVYQEVKDLSVTSYKKQQLHLYKDKLATKQKQYAKFCGADYFVYETDEFHIDDYTSIQFMKIKQFEELAKKYDEVLYLDLDVIPFMFKNFFEEHDLSKICILQQDGKQWGLDRCFKKWPLYGHLDSLDNQNCWVKACSKNSMLLLENYKVLNDNIVNTGVIGGNKDAIGELMFGENLNHMIELLYTAQKDNVYPKEIHPFMIPNNEVFFSYLIEKNKLTINNIEEKWNHIVDDTTTLGKINWKEVIFVHVINKKFEQTFPEYNLF